MLRGGFGYGVFLGVMIMLLTQVAPQPVGSIIFWSGMAVQMGYGAALVWRRMRLLVTTVGFVLVSALGVVMAWLSGHGYTVMTLPWEWGFLVWPIAVVGPVLLWVESWMSPRRWRLWKERTERAAAWEILIGRHVPDLTSLDHEAMPNGC